MAIFGKLNTIDLEISNKKRFALVVNYLTILQEEYSKTKYFHLKVGEYKRMQLDDDLFSIEQVYKTKPITECIYEAHQQYIDVHYILDGTEMISVANTKELTMDKSYDRKNDYALYRHPIQASSLILSKGDIGIFFPNDAHMTSVEANKNSTIIKTVVKIPIDKWK